MNANDLIASARKLLTTDATEADRRRAISTAYYSLFRRLCEVAGDQVVGTSSDLSRARYQVFRSVDHGAAKTACGKIRNDQLGFPEAIKEFADTFVSLQEHRHVADYCSDRETVAPSANAEQSATSKLQLAIDVVNQAEAALSRFDSADQKHLRAFSIYVLIPSTKRNQKPS